MTNGLYSWQEPFREFFGKRTKIASMHGKIIYGILEIPKCGKRYGRSRGGRSRSLLVRLDSGKYRHFRVEVIKDVEVKA